MLSEFSIPEGRMNVGKTLSAQVMEFVPWLREPNQTKPIMKTRYRENPGGCLR